jgi:hypothetical protein
LYLGKRQRFLIFLRLNAHGYHESAFFQRSGNLFLSISNGICQILVALIAGVMRGFERVVALPDSKDIEFPQPLQQSRKIQTSGPICAIK